MGKEEGGGGKGWGGSLSTYEHMESLGPGDVNTMLAVISGHCVGRGRGYHSNAG